MNLFSLISLFSYFAFFAKGYPLPVKAAYLKYGGRPQSQPTRCGHTLTRRPLPGLAGACRPSTPQKPKAGKDMNTAARRSAWLKLRVTPEEKEAITAKAAMQGQTVTDCLRQRALDYRLRQTPLEKERIRQLARIGANLNQLARWANTWKSRAEAVEILTALTSLERALLAKDTAPPPPGEPSCI